MMMMQGTLSSAESWRASECPSVKSSWLAMSARALVSSTCVVVMAAVAQYRRCGGREEG